MYFVFYLPVDVSGISAFEFHGVDTSIADSPVIAAGKVLLRL